MNNSNFDFPICIFCKIVADFMLYLHWDWSQKGKPASQMLLSRLSSNLVCSLRIRVFGFIWIMCLLSFETSSLLFYCFRFYFLLMMDIAKSETYKNFIILNKALLFLIKWFLFNYWIIRLFKTEDSNKEHLLCVAVVCMRYICILFFPCSRGDGQVMRVGNRRVR